MSSERFPPTKPSNLNAEQKKAYEIMSPLAEEFFGDTFTYKNDDGSFIGPFAPLLATPSICKPYFELIKAVSEIQGLPPTAKETVILATGSHFNGIYETYAHERVGLKTTDLTAEQINQIKVGKKPQDLDVKASVAFDAAIELVNRPGPLKKGCWDRLVEELGEQGALAVVHYVGLYAYTCVLLNGCDVQLPRGEKVMS